MKKPSVYSEKLTAKERGQVRRRVYDLRQMGFVIPQDQLVKIKNISGLSTRQLQEKILGLPGVEYRPERTSGRKAPGSPEPKLARRVIELVNVWQRKREKFLAKHGLPQTSLPAYTAEALGPAWWEAKQMTQAEINAATQRRFKEVEKTLKKLGGDPGKLFRERQEQTKQNLLKALRHSIMPYSRALYLYIRKNVMEMNEFEFYDFYDKVGGQLFDAMFFYEPELLFTGVGNISSAGSNQPIFAFMWHLTGGNLDVQLTKNETINDILNRF